MSKRCLVVYTSLTGNTQKVAERFKSTFEKHGWTCDLVRIRKRAEDILTPPFDLKDYNFICVGTGIRLHLPYNEILNVLRGLQLGEDPRFVLRSRDETIPYITDPLPDTRAPGGPERQYARHQRIVLGPELPAAVVFATYGGYEFGPKEAEPSLQLLALEIEHLGFRCIGHFCCPGRFLNDPTPRTYHGDIRDRPNETDLLKAELFIEDRLEEIAERPA